MKNVKYFVFLVLVLMVASTVSARVRNKDRAKVEKYLKLEKVTQAENPKQSIVDINNITTWVRDDGFHDWAVGGSWNGTFPKGTAGFVFSEGLVWGGKVFDGGTQLVRVGGSTYINGNKAITRLYRVRPDWATADLTDDAANFFQVTPDQVTDAMIEQLRAQYKKDWLEWPADKGAPYWDRNGNGVYDPHPDALPVDPETGKEYDIPGIPGASQTLWIYYNDANANEIYGSDPIGLEIQETYWAYSFTNPLGNVIFKRARIVYTGTASTPADAYIDSMYIVQWSDPDDGQYTDDFVGCDTTLNLGFVYNSSSVDAIYFNDWGLPPAAGGYDFLQGVATIRETRTTRL